ncbi:hypothetical protein [Mucisphaera calidilacus]|uniref:Esterase n=1 Tax=Mucisphaera calidilacus TaxID=2527982 RepID=A0A518C060_9BACT|nr:hypothetical protein [Mucisphaera calidilacus]QDU72612.1 hypothetical protein Pan265_24830 [Mucisphaera calidilacus]
MNTKHHLVALLLIALLLPACVTNSQTTATPQATDAASNAPTPPPAKPAQPLPASERLGIVLPLTHPDARVHIPDRLLDNPPETLPVIVHFHQGFNWLSEEMHTHNINAILVFFSPGGLSSKYKMPMIENPQLFDQLLAEGLDAARAQPQLPDDITIDTITVTSFSAGFGAVREILKNPRDFDRIDHIVLADTLYAGYTGDVADKKVNPDNMVDFLRYARQAVDGNKTMIITHNSYDPPGYASTAETADYLLHHLGLQRYNVNYPVGEKLTHNTRAGKGHFEVFSSPRTDGSDHAMHLRYIGFPLAMLGLPQP